MMTPSTTVASRRLVLLWLLLVLVGIPSVTAAAAAAPRRWVSVGAAPLLDPQQRSRWGRRHGIPSRSDVTLQHASLPSPNVRQWDLLALPTSRRSLLRSGAYYYRRVMARRPLWVRLARADAQVVSSSSSSSGDFPAEDDAEAYAKLGPLGKAIAGTIEIVVATALEYASGYFSGYALGTITGLPAFFLKSVAGEGAAQQQQQQQRFLAQLRQRATRMHGRSARWAGSWAGISAAFGGFRVTTKVLRGGKEDEWSTVFSSMAAGAWFARNEGPMAMVQKAFIYGGIMYLLSGNLMEKKEPFQYTEEPVDF